MIDKNPMPQARRTDIFRLLFVFFGILVVSSIVQVFSQISITLSMVQPLLSRITEDLTSGALRQEVFYTFWADICMRAITTEPVMLVSLFGTSVTVGAVLIWHMCIEKRSVAELGIVKKNIVRDYLLGAAVGVLMFSAVIAVCHLTDAVKISVSTKTNVFFVILFFVGYLIQGFSEELLLRGFLMRNLSIGHSPWTAVLLNSLFFSVLHVANNGFTLLPFLNILLFGIFASLLVLRTGSIWAAAAIHSLWNFTQGNFFGCSVSGTGKVSSFFETVPIVGKELTNGGVFGPEGGLAVTMVLVLAIAFMILPQKKQKMK